MATGQMSTTRGFNLVQAAGASNGPVIPIGGYNYGCVFIPAGETLTTLTFWVGQTEADAAFVQPYDGVSAITLTVAAGRAYRLPTDLFAYPFLRVQTNAAVVAADGIPMSFGY